MKLKRKEIKKRTKETQYEWRANSADIKGKKEKSKSTISNAHKDNRRNHISWLICPFGRERLAMQVGGEDWEKKTVISSKVGNGENLAQLYCNWTSLE